MCVCEHEARGLVSSSFFPLRVFFFFFTSSAQSHELNEESKKWNICRKKMKTSFRFSTLSQKLNEKGEKKTNKQMLLQSK